MGPYRRCLAVLPRHGCSCRKTVVSSVIHGVDPFALRSGPRGEGRRGRLRGASTISMQVSSMVDRSLKPKGIRRIPARNGGRSSPLCAGAFMDKRGDTRGVHQSRLLPGELQGIQGGVEGSFREGTVGPHPGGVRCPGFPHNIAQCVPGKGGCEILAPCSVKAGMRIDREEVEKKTADALERLTI